MRIKLLTFKLMAKPIKNQSTNYKIQSISLNSGNSSYQHLSKTYNTTKHQQIKLVDNLIINSQTQTIRGKNIQHQGQLTKTIYT